MADGPKLRAILERFTPTQATVREGTTDLSPLSELSDLEILSAYKANPVRLDTLTDLKKLRHLEINVEAVKDLSPLANMPALEHLELWWYRGQSVPANGSAVCLTIIAKEPSLLDLSPLESWKRLERLSVDRRVEGTTALPFLPKLTSLSLSGKNYNAGYSEVIGQCRMLESLGLDDTCIDDLSSFSELSKLNYLTIGETKVHDIAPILKCLSLNTVDISGTPVTDIAPLSHLGSLWTVGAAGSAVTDLTGWNTDSLLGSLNLARTGVTDIRPLAGSSLRGLYLARTPISDLSGLRALKSLSGLDISGTNVGDPAELIAHPRLLWESPMDHDHREASRYYFRFSDTPLANTNPRLSEIAAMDAPQDALREYFGMMR